MSVWAVFCRDAQKETLWELYATKELAEMRQEWLRKFYSHFPSTAWICEELVIRGEANESITEKRGAA